MRQTKQQNPNPNLKQFSFQSRSQIQLGLRFAGALRECRAMLEREGIADIELNRLADELSAILYVLSRKTDVQPAATVAEN